MYVYQPVPVVYKFPLLMYYIIHMCVPMGFSTCRLVIVHGLEIKSKHL